VVHFRLFDRLATGPLSFEELGQQLGLAERPANVLLTAVRAMGLLIRDVDDRFDLSPLAGRIWLRAALRRERLRRPRRRQSWRAGAAERLRTNRPAGAEPEQAGAAFIYREGLTSAMEQEASARRLTLALAGRARNVAPVLAERFPCLTRVCCWTSGRHGIYGMAWLQRHPQLRASSGIGPKC